MNAHGEGGTRTGAASSAVGAWLARRGLDATEIQPLAGDVSTRRYFRVALAGEAATWMVAYYPPELAAAQRRFAAAAPLLARAGVRVPAVRVDDGEAGYALVEDLGPSTLYELFSSWDGAPHELSGALAAAGAIVGLDRESVAALGNPPLDAALLRRELAQTVELLLAPRGLALPPLESALDALCASLEQRPLVPCHRDLMARNLVPVAPQGVAVLDFQDLRLGPVGYDLASLLNDSLFASPAVEARCVSEWPRLAGAAAQYRAAVVQRSLKAVGTYLAFARRGMRRHLPLVVPTLERALELFGQLPETVALGDALVERIRAAGRDAAFC